MRPWPQSGGERSEQGPQGASPKCGQAADL